MTEVFRTDTAPVMVKMTESLFRTDTSASTSTLSMIGASALSIISLFTTEETSDPTNPGSGAATESTVLTTGAATDSTVSRTGLTVSATPETRGETTGISFFASDGAAKT